MVDFRLKVFCSVAHHLSFTRASKELLVSQPAISKHIQELEAEYGTQLFERKSSGISLTPTGKLLLVHAKKILNAYRQLDFELELQLRYSGNHLRLGISHSIAQHLLSGYLDQFHERLKSIGLSVLCSNRQNVEEAVMKGEIELGVIEEGLPIEGLCYTPFRLDKCSCQQEFYFVQKDNAPQGLALLFMRYMTRNL